MSRLNGNDHKNLFDDISNKLLLNPILTDILLSFFKNTTVRMVTIWLQDGVGFGDSDIQEDGERGIEDEPC